MKKKTSGISRNLKDGTAVIDYHFAAPGGKIIHIYKKGVASVAEARILLQKMIDDKMAEINPRKNGVLFDRLFEEWITYKRASNYAIQSVDDYFYIVRKHALPKFQGRFLDDCFDPARFSDWWVRFIEQDGVSIGTKNKVARALRDLLTFARKRKYISAQTCLDDQDVAVWMKKGIAPKKVVPTWDDEQIEAFFKNIDPRSMNYLMFRLAFWLGCRPAELLALQGKRHVNGTIVIQQQVIERRGYPAIIVPRLKTNTSYRVCPLTQELDECLRAYEKTYEIGPDDFLFFTRAKDRWMSKTEFNRRLKRYWMAARLPHINPKGIRHTKAKQFKKMTRTTAESQAASKFLGHTPEVDTNVYGKATDDDVREFIDGYIDQLTPRKKA